MKTKENRAITLIALVVTIILLLILAGVSIAMLTGQNGILNRAVEAKEKNQNMQINEKIKIAMLEAISVGKGSITNDEIENALNNNIGKGQYIITGNEQAGWKVEINGNEYKIETTGEVSNFNGWTSNESNTIFTNSDGKKLSVGEYVNYNCIDFSGTSSVDSEKIYTYTSSKEKNGYDTQIFKLEDYKNLKWQVIGIDDVGNLELISSDIIEPYNIDIKYTLQGQNGYTFGLEELNNISGIYGQGKCAKYARSVNIDDINKITGYKDDNYKKDTDNTFQTGNEVTYTLDEEGKIHYIGNKFPSLDMVGEYSNFIYYKDGKWKNLQSGESVTMRQSYYNYYPQTLTTTPGSGENINGMAEDIGKKVYDLLFLNTNTKFYWLASQFIDIHDGRAFYGLRRVNNIIGGYSIYKSDGEETKASQGIRPIVVLDAKTLIKSGNGTQDSPYEIDLN